MSAKNSAFKVWIDDPKDEPAMELAPAPSSYAQLAVSCACPLPGPCRCGSVVE